MVIYTVFLEIHQPISISLGFFSMSLFIYLRILSPDLPVRSLCCGEERLSRQARTECTYLVIEHNRETRGKSLENRSRQSWADY